MGVPGSAKNVKLALDFEQTWGAPKSTPTLHYMSFMTSGVKAAQPLIFNQSIRADFNPLAPVLDKSDAGLSLVHYPTLETIPFFTKWLTGTLAETGTTPNFVLTSKLGSTAPPSVVAEAETSIGGTARFLKGLGLVIESFDVEWDATGFLQFTIQAIGKAGSVETASIDTPSGPDDWTAGTPLNHLQISVLKLGGSTTTVIKKGKLSVKTNPYKDDYRAGQGAGRLSALPGTFEISGTLDIVMDSTTILGSLAAGISGSSLEITWTESTDRYFTLSLPKITVQAALPALGDSPILMVPGAQFSAYYDSSPATAISLVTGSAYQATKYA